MKCRSAWPQLAVILAGLSAAGCSVFSPPLTEEQVTSFAISLDDTREALDKYLATADLPWPVIHDDAEDPLKRLQLKFGVASLPTVLLLNKEGTVVSLEARGAELDRLMQMIFEAPTPAEPPPGADKSDASEKSADTTSTTQSTESAASKK